MLGFTVYYVDGVTGNAGYFTQYIILLITEMARWYGHELKHSVQRTV